MFCFYHVQGDKGDSELHPNAFVLPSVSEEGMLTLEEFVRLFPLAGTSPFHFRFQVPSPAGAKVYLDMCNPRDRVPVVNGAVIAKVLRLDALKCASINPLPLGHPIPSFKPTSSSPTHRAATPASAATPRGPAPAVAHSPPQPQQHSPTQRPSTTGPLPVRAAQHVARPAGGTTAPARAPAPAPAAGDAGGSAAAVAFPRAPARRTSDEDNLLGGFVSADAVAAAKAAGVDEDLAGKSEWVQAQVMARREAEARKHDERVAAVKAEEERKLQAEALKDAYKVTLGPKLRDWAESTGGLKKDVRTLISTLHTVLWPSAKWEEVSMSKLIDPNRVKLHFHKASRVVHPDHNNTASEEQKFIATSVFHVLNAQYRVFEASELNKAA